ncbi:kelch-like protein 31 [Eurytemora carolleeae]|uniref:kelch-like protein 31 n=1 Tax=Eurytemora carolleeae TaxID=1294199 RepID=UPI000C787A4E|nr:kelch-like protein 31 [Eurytemora carolleeae]|eukprot:XP_023341305.1 kelch-like protein 31 [Eurytemora affinis]
MKQVTWVSVLLLFCVQGFLTAEAGEDWVSLIIGGLGGGIGNELITAESVCNGNEATPNIPPAEFGYIFGWSAALFSSNMEKGEIMLCGGKDTIESKKCYNLPVGSSSWKRDVCELERERINANMFSTSDGKIVISGGYSSKAGWLKDVQMLQSYDPDCTSNCCQWDNIGTIDGKGVYSHCALQYDEDHFVFMGGNTWDSNGQYDIADVQIFNYKTGQWTKGKDIPIPRQGHGCIKTTHNGRDGIMIAGGFCNGNPNHPDCYQLRLDSTMFYDFESDEWTELSPLNNARDGLVLNNVEGTIMAIGGQYRGAPVEIIEKWNGDSWEESISLKDKVSSFANVQVKKTDYKC